MPERIQMTRNKPWRKENPSAVIVARPTKWGNRYKVGDTAYINGKRKKVDSAAMAVDLYRHWISHYANPLSAEIIRELRGHDLACWCPLDQPCHADVLLEIANTPIHSV